ncbi:glycerate kinase [Klebsiella pneumoniae subsp. pneumoniae]|nr:glycerate kinase [Klebsiella pneumoniae subsp. pneumoniae]
MLELLNADDHLRDAALTIVGEGWLDRQSAFGKAPVGVAGKAARHGVPVVALCGGRDESSRQLYQHHIDAMWYLPAPYGAGRVDEHMRTAPRRRRGECSTNLSERVARRGT